MLAVAQVDHHLRRHTLATERGIRGLGLSDQWRTFEPLVSIQSMNRKQATPCQRLRNNG